MVQRGVFRRHLAGPPVQSRAAIDQHSAGRVTGQADDPRLPGPPAVPAQRVSEWCRAVPSLSGTDQG